MVRYVLTLCSEIDKLIDNSIELYDFFELHKKTLETETMFLMDDTDVSLLFEKIYQQNRNEDLVLLSKCLDKRFKYFDNESFHKMVNEINEKVKSESDDMKCILQNDAEFDYLEESVGYKINLKSKIRNIKGVDDFIIACVILNGNTLDTKRYIENFNILFDNVIFDKNVVKSIENLNDGIELRRKEIAHHLYIIHNEIPSIINDGIKSYGEIGNRLTIGCSPERDRQTVKDHLTAEVDSIEINCELHTKLKRLSSKAPDRIYFCPSVPQGKFKGNIFIYKISSHV